MLTFWSKLSFDITISFWGTNELLSHETFFEKSAVSKWEKNKKRLVSVSHRIYADVPFPSSAWWLIDAVVLVYISPSVLHLIALALLIPSLTSLEGTWLCWGSPMTLLWLPRLLIMIFNHIFDWNNYVHTECNIRGSSKQTWRDMTLSSDQHFTVLTSGCKCLKAGLYTSITKTQSWCKAPKGNMGNDL